MIKMVQYKMCPAGELHCPTTAHVMISCIEILIFDACKVDSDQTQHSAVSDLGLQHLLRFFFGTGH